MLSREVGLIANRFTNFKRKSLHIYCIGNLGDHFLVEDEGMREEN